MSYRVSKVPALDAIDKMARKMSLEWVSPSIKSLRERLGEQEIAYRMFVAAARKGREIERKGMRSFLREGGE